MFITDAIVLKKIYIKENLYSYHVFSRDFWKVSCWLKGKKTNTPIDIGGMIQCSLSTKGDSNTIESYKIKRAVLYDGLDYEGILNIMKCIKTISSVMPEWVPHPTLFDDYKTSLPYFEQKDENEKAIGLFLLKVLKISWIVGERNRAESDNFKRIYRNIEKMEIKKIYSIQWIDEELIKEIKQINEFSITTFLQ